MIPDQIMPISVYIITETKLLFLKSKLDGKKNVKREVVEEENEDQERIYGDKNDSNSKGPQEDISLQVSPVLIMVFVCMMCLMLLLLYFFFDKLGE